MLATKKERLFKNLRLFIYEYLPRRDHFFKLNKLSKTERKNVLSAIVNSKDQPVLK